MLAFQLQQQFTASRLDCHGLLVPRRWENRTRTFEKIGWSAAENLCTSRRNSGPLGQISAFAICSPRTGYQLGCSLLGPSKIGRLGWGGSACCGAVRMSFTTIRAGFPMATANGGISVRTTLLTPMTAPSPIVTPFMIQQPPPSQAPRQIRTGFISLGGGGKPLIRASVSRGWASVSAI